MRKIREYVLKGKEVFVGIDDSKRTWKVCVRSGRLVVHEASMPAQYEVLRSYFRNKFPNCRIRVTYKAGVVTSFLGLIPSDYSTGEQERKGHITKQGNRVVRTCLVETAWLALRHDPVLLEKYRRVAVHDEQLRSFEDVDRLVSTAFT